MKNILLAISITLCVVFATLFAASFSGQLYSAGQMEKALVASANADITNAKLAWDAPKDRR